jgi:hypothetical protein
MKTSCEVFMDGAWVSYQGADGRWRSAEIFFSMRHHHATLAASIGDPERG